MPRFMDVERKERSLILGLWRASRRAPVDAKGVSGPRWSLFVTFAEGMEELVTALASRLPSDAARLKERVASVTREGAGWRVGQRVSERRRQPFHVEPGRLCSRLGGVLGPGSIRRTSRAR